MAEMVPEQTSEIDPSKRVRRAIFPLLDRSFQIKVTLFFILLILLSHLFLLALHYRNLMHSTQGSLGKTGIQLELYLAQERRVWTRDLMLGVLGISAMVSLVVFYLTQKVSGPLFAMARVLDEAQKGNLSERARLRQGDELQWFAEKLNHTLDVLEKDRKK